MRASHEDEARRRSGETRGQERRTTINSKLRRQVALVAIGAMFAAVAIPAVLSIPALRGDEPQDERPAVPLDGLLLSRPATDLPGDPSWSLYGTWRLEGEPRANVARRWTDGGDSARLTQTVQEYGSAAAADRAYRSGNPITFAAENAGSPALAGSVPAGLDADSSLVGCVGGSPPECNIWVYWARYGQYNVSLNSTSIDTRVPYSTFATHIVDSDRIIADRLR